MVGTSFRNLTRLAAAVVVVMGILAWSQAQDKKNQKEPPADDEGRPVMTLRDFMRVKLKASNQILEGLAIEDMEMVQAGAQTLKTMSTAEKWRVYNDAMYRQFSGEFQRSVTDLEKAAKENNLDSAAMKWVATTMNCIECHRYVRHHLVVESAGKP